MHLVCALLNELFGPVALGKAPGLSQVFLLIFYTMEPQFVPGTNPVCPWDNPGTKGGKKVYVLKVYVPFSLAILLSSITGNFRPPPLPPNIY